VHHFRLLERGGAWEGAPAAFQQPLVPTDADRARLWDHAALVALLGDARFGKPDGDHAVAFRVAQYLFSVEAWGARSEDRIPI
jgi:hypothetical protein